MVHVRTGFPDAVAAGQTLAEWAEGCQMQCDSVSIYMSGVDPDFPSKCSIPVNCLGLSMQTLKCTRLVKVQGSVNFMADG